MNPRDVSFRWRATHQSKVGPICPKCREPLETHFINYNMREVMMGRTKVRSGITQRVCFEVKVR
jgi:hypothetical protein